MYAYTHNGLYSVSKRFWTEKGAKLAAVASAKKFNFPGTLTIYRYTYAGKEVVSEKFHSDKKWINHK